jgi:hypothetical protein
MPLDASTQKKYTKTAIFYTANVEQKFLGRIYGIYFPPNASVCISSLEGAIN